MYTEYVLNGAIVPKSTAVFTAEDLSAAAAVYGGYLVGQQVKISRIMFVVTTLVEADTTAPVVEFNRRPTPGSATGEVLLGQLTIPEGTAVGKVIYKDITPVVLYPGDEISLEHVTQAADSGTAAGAGFYLFGCELDPEMAANQSDMVASA